MQVGFIGLGEVGTVYSVGLKEHGANVKGFDVLALDPANRERFRRCTDAGIVLADSLQELIEDCDYILSVTSSKTAIAVAESCAPFLKNNQTFIDMNSAVPEKKRRIAEILRHCMVVDGITMSSPSQFGIRTEVVFSGPEAARTVRDFNQYGMNTRCIGEEIGQAGALKVLRSVFTKGFEAVLIESLMAADYFHVYNDVYATICSFVENSGIRTSMDFMVRTNVVHAERRGDEVRGVAEMMADAGLDHRMASVSAEKLYWLQQLNVKEAFHGSFAETPRQAIDAMLDAMLRAEPKEN